MISLSCCVFPIGDTLPLFPTLFGLWRLRLLQGDLRTTQRLAEERLQVAEQTHEAELYRIKGALTLESQVESHKSKVEEAEACFLKAIEIAQKQQAKSLELRAVMSLARLWQSQGKTTEAQQMLADIYGWFTEGFDTKDLQEAKALIDELSD